LGVEAIGEKTKKLLSAKGIGAVAIGVLAGLALMLLPFSEESEGTEISTELPISSVEYCNLLEEKAESLILELPQVKECNVFITLESGFRYIYATDQHIKEVSGSKETDKTIVLAGNGSGEAPILIEESMPKVAGVAVVCSGADYQTQYRIIELMCALFEIKSNRISVQT
jgi:stage III sporulation protein AG